MNGKIFFLLLFLLLLGAGGWYMYQQKGTGQQVKEIKIPVKKGDLNIEVTATGELQAKKSEKIYGPQGMSSKGIYQTTISNIVPEGTIVKEGDYVATLDRTELSNKIEGIGNDIEKAESQLMQTKLDTTLEMSGLRDQLINIQFSIEEKKSEIELNVYEPKAVQKQIQSDLEKLERDYRQSEKNYLLKQEQAAAKVQEIAANRRQHKNNMRQMKTLGEQFEVKAPKAGMVIYEKGWGGKIGPGSRINAWNPVVARLPDLSNMVSKTYVNEVDISRVRIGQSVDIQVDAFPDKKYPGKVVKVANIGEKRPNFDAKVFEVNIELTESDSILRPAMTTANTILTQTHEDVSYIPLEALHSNDSINYVFTYKEGRLVRKEVLSGAFNEEFVIIQLGLNEGEDVLLSIPEKPEELRLLELSITDKVKYRREQKEATAKPEEQKTDDVKKLQDLPAEVREMVKKGKRG